MRKVFLENFQRFFLFCLFLHNFAIRQIACHIVACKMQPTIVAEASSSSSLRVWTRQVGFVHTPFAKCFVQKNFCYAEEIFKRTKKQKNFSKVFFVWKWGALYARLCVPVHTSTLTKCYFRYHEAKRPLYSTLHFPNDSEVFYILIALICLWRRNFCLISKSF